MSRHDYPTDRGDWLLVAAAAVLLVIVLPVPDADMVPTHPLCHTDAECALFYPANDPACDGGPAG